MPVTITTQSQMQRVREAIKFCYLCGSLLTSGRRAQSGRSGEHVIPQALFGDPPATDAWRPILDVHNECHDQIKNAQGEQTAILLHKAYMLEGDIADQGWAGNLKSLGLVLHAEYDPRLGQTLYMVKGFGDAHNAVWNWVRGLHASLYQQYLPGQMKHKTYAPMGESFIPEPGDTQHHRIGPEVFHEQKAPIARTLAAVASLRRFDGLRCWCGRCQYICVWTKKKSRDHMCVWGLFYDGVGDYAEGTPFSGSPGWMGMYKCARPPPNRTIAATIP